MGTSSIEDMFLAFRDECIGLRIAQQIHEQLYESGDETLKLLEDSAGLFFHDLQDILIEHIFLKVCRLTDVPKARARDNLTVDQVCLLLDQKGGLTEEIRAHAEAMCGYGDKLRPARNRRIAHADLLSIINGEENGEHEARDYRDFFEHMQLFCDCVGDAVGVGPSDFRVVPGAGDVLDLIVSLRRARAV